MGYLLIITERAELMAVCVAFTHHPFTHKYRLALAYVRLQACSSLGDKVSV